MHKKSGIMDKIAPSFLLGEGTIFHSCCPLLRPTECDLVRCAALFCEAPTRWRFFSLSVMPSRSASRVITQVVFVFVMLVACLARQPGKLRFFDGENTYSIDQCDH